MAPRQSDEPSSSHMETSEPTNAEASSSHVLNDSFSCFEDEDDADILSMTEATSSADETLPTSQSRHRLVRPLIVALILGVGLVISVTAYTVTKQQDERLCQGAATEAANNMLNYAEESLRTEVDSSTFDVSVDNCKSSWPAVLSAILAMCFLLAALGFVVYDRRQQSKFDKAQDLAERTTSLVASLYPKQVRDRLLNQDQTPKGSKRKQSHGKRTVAPGSVEVDDTTVHKKNSLSEEALTNRSGHSQTQSRKSTMDRTKSSLKDVEETGALFTSRPIADLFPEVSLLFADLAGFTAWSSARQPTEV